MQEKHGLRVSVEDDGAAKPLDDTVKVVLFKAVRELLMNVVKHARASRAVVLIRKAGGSVELVVEDDGVGLPIEKTAAAAIRSGGFGLFSIREGLRHCGGEFTIRPGKRGTRAMLKAPLQVQAQGL